ncbi:MAG: hypothetical protein ACLS4Z_10300 [Christensenellaceae bacterium]
MFSETEYDLETVEERLNELAFLNRGLEITLIDERISMAEAKPRKQPEPRRRGERGRGNDASAAVAA